MSMDREIFLADIENKGEAECPCCKRFARVYKRKLNSGMARDLIKMYRLGGFHAPVCVSALGTNGPEISRLRRWGFVRPIEKQDGDEHKKTSGKWMITENGLKFIHDELKVPSHIVTLDNDFMGFDGKAVNITACLGKHFNYQELMEAK